MKKILFVCLIGLFIGCSSGNDPQKIVDETLAVSGSNKLDNSKVEFVFRDKEYGFKRSPNGLYEMVRLFKDSTGLVRDVVTNHSFHREINGKEVSVADSMAFKYTNSINSVIYFALLPYGLNDAAVIKSYMNDENIKDKIYHKIKVTFKQEGGGVDYEDEFIYWINKETKFVDYLAYSYHTDEGGLRFREVINPRMINGLRVVDYINYKPKIQVDLEETGKAFQAGQLEELSRIKLENFVVEFN
ncbi:MAG TPA: hypothetical protein PKL31_10800 [Fulvivirga sp.]|nr:hypothetical protein [Fulvivirga sp.]